VWGEEEEEEEEEEGVEIVARGWRNLATTEKVEKMVGRKRKQRENVHLLLLNKYKNYCFCIW